MDLRWLDAPDEDVRRELPTVPEHEPPPWVPTRRRLLVRLNAVIQVWTLFIVVFNTGLDVDIRGDGTLEADDVRTLVITLVVAIVWTAASIALWRWSRKASTPVRLRRARRALTARANEFRAEAWWRDSFTAIVTAHSAGVREYPRFVGEGIEFGTVRLRMPRTRPRSYVCVSLASPLPHLVLDAVENDGVRSGLPENLAERQRISLEGDFDRIFRAYAPRGYARDALYVLTPDVMAVLADHARAFDVEIIEDRAVFFRAERRGGTTRRCGRRWTRSSPTSCPAATTLAAIHGREGRGPGRGRDRGESRERFVGGHAWRPDAPVVGPGGRQLRSWTPRHGWWANVRVVSSFMVGTAVYGIPVFLGVVTLLGMFDGR